MHIKSDLGRGIAAATLIVVDWLWSIFLIGGCSYLVFWEGHSGWWFSLAVLLTQWSAPKGVFAILGQPEPKED